MDADVAVERPLFRSCGAVALAITTRWQRAHTRDANTYSSVRLNSGCSPLPDVLCVKRDTVLVANSVDVERIRIDVYKNILAQD